MYVGRDFDVMNATESEVLSIDFVNDLQTGETLVGLPTVTLTVFSGTDATPSARLSGDPGAVGTVAMQRVAQPLAGVTYIITFSVVTSLGNTKVLYSRIPVLAVY